MDCQRGSLLGSKELGTNVLELHFVMLTNYDQNVLVLFRLAQSMCLYVKLESSSCRIYCVNLPGLIDRVLDSINRARQIYTVNPAVTRFQLYIQTHTLSKSKQD